MLVLRSVVCPYCGETFATNVDISAGSQQYIEDCQVCCRPITFRTAVDHDGNLALLEVHRDDG
jgi:hypothetical protein